MKKADTIIAANTAPQGLAGYCACGAALYNPVKEEHLGLSLTLRWEIQCPGCGERVTIDNPRFLAKAGRK